MNSPFRPKTINVPGVLSDDAFQQQLKQYTDQQNAIQDSAPAPDWVATVQILLDAGAPTDEITLDPDDPKPPSPAVRDLLRARAITGTGQIG